MTGWLPFTIPPLLLLYWSALNANAGCAYELARRFHVPAVLSPHVPFADIAMLSRLTGVNAARAYAWAGLAIFFAAPAIAIGAVTRETDNGFLLVLLLGLIAIEIPQAVLAYLWSRVCRAAGISPLWACFLLAMPVAWRTGIPVILVEFEDDAGETAGRKPTRARRRTTRS